MEGHNITPAIQVREAILSYRYLSELREAIREPRDIVRLFWQVARNNVQEHVCVFCLDGNHTVVNCSLLFTGTANQAAIHPREVYQMAVIAGACGIILAHNHPSGSLEESPEDRGLTQRLKEVGTVIGIPLIDHLVVTESGYNSAKDRGWL